MDAHELDESDALKWLRGEFHLPSGIIYMDGNSLGLLSKPAERSLLDVLDTWKRLGIEGWLKGDNPWYFFAEKLGALAAPLLGAHEDEVIVAGSTSSNLHQLLATFYKPQGRRTKILIEEAAFPTDAHIAQSHLRLHGLDPHEHLVVVPSAGGTALNEADIARAMGDDIAIAILPVVLYRTGQLLDVKRITDAAHACGALICFDGCHSVGVLEHAFHDGDVDMAVFCTYKYLNGGPGSSGGLYVHRRHLGARPGLASWWSSRKDRQFDMSNTLEHADGAGAFQVGTPNLLSMAPLLGALELVHKAGIANIRKRSLAIVDFMMDRIDSELADLGFTLATPREPARRGAHVALRHKEAPRICKALKARGAIPDFRPPDIVRLAPSPYYTSFTEAAETVTILKDIVQREAFLAFENTRDVVA